MHLLYWGIIFALVVSPLALMSLFSFDLSNYHSVFNHGNASEFFRHPIFLKEKNSPHI